MNQFSEPEMQEIFEGFLVETQELLDSLSHDLMVLENEPNDFELLNSIFRSFHTIKGTSSFMGFSHIAGITHHAEDILNKLRHFELAVSRPIIDVLLEVQDWIALMIDKLKVGEEILVDYSTTIAEIERLRNSGGPVSSGILQVEAQAVVDAHSQVASAMDEVLNNTNMVTKPGDFTDDELDLIQRAFDEMNLAFKNENIQAVNAETNDSLDAVVALTPENHSQTEIAVKNIEADNDPKVSELRKIEDDKSAKSNKKPSETIRIDVERVEALMDLSGELVLGRNRLQQLTEYLGIEFKDKNLIKDLVESTAQIDFVTSEIQTAVMKMRMVPIAKLYQKAPRIVRDLAKEFGKKIKLELKGEDTEIDRGIIEELNDPLVHMIRNSCDHGVESTEKRIAAGKSEIGTIILDAEQEGNNIVIRITDDGAGMDPEKLKSKAIEKGVINLEQAQAMTSREAFQLIFAPGFSTAAVVSAVSGRGVGMDVVRTNIQKLKGMIEIESVIGKGTTFIIKLPLTLAIIQGLLVNVQKETYAIPLSSVIEVVAVDPDKVSTVNKQEVIRIRKEVLPIIRLDKALLLNGDKQQASHKYVVNVGFGAQRVGLVVDELLGQQEIVIKSLGEYLGNIKGIAGSTILGDGRVIMIIDVGELVNSIYQNQYSHYKK